MRSIRLISAGKLVCFGLKLACIWFVLDFSSYLKWNLNISRWSLRSPFCYSLHYSLLSYTWPEALVCITCLALKAGELPFQ